jgi:hypothetical protein
VTLSVKEIMMSRDFSTWTRRGACTPTGRARSRPARVDLTVSGRSACCHFELEDGRSYVDAADLDPARTREAAVTCRVRSGGTLEPEGHGSRSQRSDGAEGVMDANGRRSSAPTACAGTANVEPMTSETALRLGRALAT